MFFADLKNILLIQRRPALWFEETGQSPCLCTVVYPLNLPPKNNAWNICKCGRKQDSVSDSLFNLIMCVKVKCTYERCSVMTYPLLIFLPTQRIFPESTLLTLDFERSRLLHHGSLVSSMLSGWWKNSALVLVDSSHFERVEMIGRYKKHWS